MQRILAVALIATLALAGSAPAQSPAKTPQSAPVPEERPEMPKEGTSGDGSQPPAPKARPADDAKDDDGKTGAAKDDRPEDAGPAEPPVRETLAETDEAFAACIAALNELGARFVERPAMTEAAERDCGIARPVAVSELLPGVKLQPEAVLRCGTALALAGWLKEFVLPAADRLPDRGRLSGVDHGTAYLCRPRNGIAGETLSEHAFGNAIDIAGFRFEKGEALTVAAPGREGSIEEAFVQAVRKTACLSFTTVLGPGSDAAHADHLHLDVKARKGGFRLCQ